MAKAPKKEFHLYRVLFRHEIAPGKQLFTDVVGNEQRDEIVLALGKKGATIDKVVELTP